MKYKRRTILLPASFLFLLSAGTACGNKVNKSQESATAVDTITAFILPSIPTLLNTPKLRADHLVRHYWDNVNFADSNYIHHPEITEQAWVDYIDILKQVPAKTADIALKNAFSQAAKEKKCYLYLVELADKYLYDPNSPMRNEELYISVLDILLAAPVLNETEKIRPQARRKLAQKNRISTKAFDFTYTLASGKQGNLYSLHTPYILLFINNPGCHTCMETIEELKNATFINQAISKKQLTILSLYPDVDMEEWKKHNASFPPEWINGYDKKQIIETNNLYDLKAIPTLYLLNKEKTVLLKDVMAVEVEDYLAKQK